MTNKGKQITACMDCLHDPCMCMQLMTGAFAAKESKAADNVIYISTPKKYASSFVEQMVMKITKSKKTQLSNPCAEIELPPYKFIGADMANKPDISTEWTSQPPPDMTVTDAIGNLMTTLHIKPSSGMAPEFIGGDVHANGTAKEPKYTEEDFLKAYKAYKKETESKIAKELAKAKKELAENTDEKNYMPTMFHTHGMDVLRCPICEGIHLQQVVATVYERPEDNAPFGTVVKVTQEGAFSTEHLTGNPSPRRNAVVTQLRCEDCKSVLDFTLAHVKGSTVIRFTEHKEIEEDGE